jgi:spectinomycin phosphotransferase
VAAIAGGWGLELAGANYVEAGAGSYHWIVADGQGNRHFVTVDDLDRKDFLGDTQDAAFEGLRLAFDTAVVLRAGGLDFVVAPLPTLRGESVSRIDSRYSIAVFPFIEGRAGQFSERLAPDERADLVDLLVQLHRATPSVASTARRTSIGVPGRRALVASLRDLDRDWSGGPFSERARDLLAEHADGVRRLLDTFDQLTARVAAEKTEPVLTHGEPHPANVIRAGGRLVLIDWDTVALARPERDLWLVDSGDGRELALYAAASGRRINEDAIAMYRIRWQLDDIAIFVDELRSAHEQNADIEHAWASLVRSMPSALC